MPSALDKLYERSPILLQNMMATGYGIRQRLLRNRGEYPRFVAELEEQQWWSLERLQATQDELVRRTVRSAATNVPYYRELFARERLRPEDIRSAADLSVLPFLDKATVQREGARLRPDRGEARCIPQTTGGTTGRPVTYWVTPSCIQFNYAIFEARVRRWGGCTFGDRLVSINGKPIVPMGQVGPPFWRRNLAFNQLYVSAYHLSDENLPAIVERIAQFRPVLIVAYVSSIHRIARFINERGLAGEIKPRAVMTSSETLYPWLRADIERAFGCRVFNGYSLGEPVCAVSECASGGMHVSMEYGAVELMPDGEGCHEVVATGLINEAMPLLRYRTGDRAEPGDGKPCPCGRGLRLVREIIGRVDEMVLTPEGTSVGPAALSLAFQAVPNLRESQIVQERQDAITLRLAVSQAYRPADEQFLLVELRKRLGPTLRIDLEYMPSVPRTVSGKQQLVVSRLDHAR